MGEGIAKVTVKKILYELEKHTEVFQEFVNGVKAWKKEDVRQHQQRLPEYKKSVDELQKLNSKMDMLIDIMRNR